MDLVRVRHVLEQDHGQRAVGESLRAFRGTGVVRRGAEGEGPPGEPRRKRAGDAVRVRALERACDSAIGGGGRVRPRTPRTTTGAGVATRGARAYLELEHGGGHHLDDARGRARGSKPRRGLFRRTSSAADFQVFGVAVPSHFWRTRPPCRRRAKALGRAPVGAHHRRTPTPSRPRRPRDTSPHSPGGGIETLPDGGGYRATVDGRVLGTFATLQEAASEMTHAAMTPPASRTTPRSRAKRSEPSHGVTTPEHAARTPLPGNPARSGDAKPDPEKTLYARRRDRNVFTRAFVMCAVLAVLVALLDPNIASTASTRLGALVSEWRGVTADGAAVAAKPESCASEVARFDAVAALAAEGWRETAWLFLEAARGANARHREETDSIASRGFGGLLFSNPPTRRPRASAASRLGAKKGVALALVAQTRFDSGPDDRVALRGARCLRVRLRGDLRREEVRRARYFGRGERAGRAATRDERLPGEVPPRRRRDCPRAQADASAPRRARARGERGRALRARRAGRARATARRTCSSPRWARTRARGGVARARRGGVRARRQGGDGASLARADEGEQTQGNPLGDDAEAATGSGVTEAFRRRVDFVVPFPGVKED